MGKDRGRGKTLRQRKRDREEPKRLSKMELHLFGENNAVIINATIMMATMIAITMIIMMTATGSNQLPLN